MKVLAAFLILSGLPITASSNVSEYRMKLNASNVSAVYVVSAVVLANATNQSSQLEKYTAAGASVDYAQLKARTAQCFMRDIRVCGGDVMVDWACEGSADDKRSKFSLNDDFKVEKLEFDAPPTLCLMPSWNPQ